MTLIPSHSQLMNSEVSALEGRVGCLGSGMRETAHKYFKTTSSKLFIFGKKIIERAFNEVFVTYCFCNLCLLQLPGIWPERKCMLVALTSSFESIQKRELILAPAVGPIHKHLFLFYFIPKGKAKWCIGFREWQKRKENYYDSRG